MKTIWILTKEFNAYDQHGGYFEGAFLTEQDAKDSVPVIGRHRQKDGWLPDEWYELEEVEIGKLYPE